MDKPAIKVLIVDDSKSIRMLLTQILSSDPQIEVVGCAEDAIVARDMIKMLRPDVLTLDVEMPRMDGLTFLEKLMAGHPMPVVMISSLTGPGCEATMLALALGAVDFFPKPKMETLFGEEQAAEQVIAKVKGAAQAKIRRSIALPSGPAPNNPAAIDGSDEEYCRSVIAIGASTGGTEAIREILMFLPENSPGILFAQHMPEGFSAAFAKKLDSIGPLRVKEAEDGDTVKRGSVLIAPGNRHMTLQRHGSTYRVHVAAGPPVNGQRPSVDVLFHSVAEAAGPDAVGVILTGMGEDGARGLKEMRAAGARTIAQDEASCMVFGMSKAAIALNAAEIVAPLPVIAFEMMNCASSPPEALELAVA
jgi:two-component system chemotaxis response regulator CheB